MNLETPPDVARQMMCGIMRIRMIEERIRTLYAEQEMRCPTHFSIGQEAVAVGVCVHLKREDLITSAHRSHAHYLAKGGDLKAMLAELYGKATGCAAGKGGSMHLRPLGRIPWRSADRRQYHCDRRGRRIEFRVAGRASNDRHLFWRRSD